MSGVTDWLDKHHTHNWTIVPSPAPCYDLKVEWFEGCKHYKIEDGEPLSENDYQCSTHP